MTETDMVDDRLPLTAASFQVLLVLAAGPAHGYGIMLEADRSSEGKTRLGAGTLYRTLQRLVDDELIEPLGTETDERRVPYRLTSLGLAVAKGEAARLAQLVRLARRRGLLSPGPRARFRREVAP